MVGGLVDEPVAERGEMLTLHALIIGAGEALPKVTDDGIDEKQLAVLIPVMPPRICAALADDLEGFPSGMVTPDGAVELCPRAIRCARFPDGGCGLNPVPPVEPAVRPPFETVDDVMADGVVLPAIEQHFRGSVRNIIAVTVGDKDEVRGARRKNSTEAKRDARELLSLIPEHFVCVEMASALGVLENQNTIVKVCVEVHPTVAVSIELGDPKAATIIKRHGDRLADVRFRREHGHPKARRHGNAPGRLCCRQRLVDDRSFTGCEREKKSEEEVKRAEP